MLLLLRRETSLTRRITTWLFGTSSDHPQNYFQEHSRSKVISAFKLRFNQVSQLASSCDSNSLLSESIGSNFEKGPSPFLGESNLNLTLQFLEIKLIPKLLSFFKLFFHDFPVAAEMVFADLVPSILNVIYSVSGKSSSTSGIAGEETQKPSVPGNIFISIQQSVNSLLETISSPTLIWDSLFKILHDLLSQDGQNIQSLNAEFIDSPLHLIESFFSILYPEYWTSLDSTLFELIKLFTLLQQVKAVSADDSSVIGGLAEKTEEGQRRLLHRHSATKV